ncbi:hypothetical protein PybrP1_001429 [[Pythium] brassicae (nom. inval.)]|nr:hypothetical protein PybrP1_001429 [[Pythium] brassicae (nom. inval.)]
MVSPVVGICRVQTVINNCAACNGTFQLMLVAVAAAEVGAKVAGAALPLSSDAMTDASIVPAAGVLRRALCVAVPERLHGDSILHTTRARTRSSRPQMFM